MRAAALRQCCRLAARSDRCTAGVSAAASRTARGVHLHHAALRPRPAPSRAVSSAAAVSASSSSSSPAATSGSGSPINSLPANNTASASGGSPGPPAAPPSPSSSSSSSAGVRPPLPPVRPPRLLRNGLLASLLALCLYLHHSASSAAVSAATGPPASCSCSPPPVSCTEEEVLELVSRVRLRSEDVVAVYAEVMRRHGRLGLVTLEQYGRVVEDAARKAREARRRSREQREASREERARLLQQRQAEQQAGTGSPSSQETKAEGEEDEEELQASYWDEQEEQEEREEKEQRELAASPAPSEARERQLRDSLRRRAFEGWELLCLHRASLPVTGSLYDVRELCIGLAQLAYDHGSWEEVKAELQREGSWKQGRRCSRRERLMLSYQPWKKLELVWRISLPAGRGDGRLSYDEVALMVERMLRTGHFSPGSVLTPCSASPLAPQQLLMDARHITHCLFRQLHADSRSDVDERLRGAFQQEPTVVPLPPPLCAHSASSQALSSAFLTFDFSFLSQLSPLSPAALLSTPAFTSASVSPAVPLSASVSYAELLSVCRSQAVQGRCRLWYLVPRDRRSGERAGAVKKRRMQLQERLRQLAFRTAGTEDGRQAVERLLL